MILCLCLAGRVTLSQFRVVRPSISVRELTYWRWTAAVQRLSSACYCSSGCLRLPRCSHYLRSRPVQCCGYTRNRIISKLFHRLIGAQEYFPTCSMSL